MTTPGHCKQCGKDLPADAPQGLCPQCLMKLGLPSEAPTREGPEKTLESGSAAAFSPPSPEELSEQFHQLEILELLGKGGMGAVYKARQKHLDRFVALKILPPKVGRDPAFTERFTREARSLARLSHPHIVTVHDFGRTPTGLCYFLMEYVDGTDLRKVIASKTMTPHEALAIVPQVCEALQFAHERGIVHRDIKPENILIDKNGKVKIADFGLARLLDSAADAYTLTAVDQRMGTPLYMAPEQVEHPHSVDHRADIYSLGVVFYEMLTGELPLGRFAPPSQKVHVDVRLDHVVLRTLEKEPELRYQHVSEVKTEVETISSSPAPERPVRAPAPAAALALAPAAPACDDATEAPRQLRVPAIGLIVTGTLALIATALVAAFIGLRLVAIAHGISLIFLVTVAGALVALVPPILVILAGRSMLRLSSYGLALAGSLIALLPCTALWPFSFIFAIWSLVILNRSNVRAAFSSVRSGGGSSVGKVILIILLVMFLLGGLLLAVLAFFIPVMAASHRVQVNAPESIVAVGHEPGFLPPVAQEIAGLDFPQGRPGFVDYTPAGPVLSDTCVETLGLQPVRPQLDAVLAKAWTDYTAIESQHSQIARSGDVLRATIEPFRPQSEQFLRQLWKDLDGVLSEPQRIIARGELPLNAMFGRLGFGEHALTLNIIKRGDIFEYQIEYGPSLRGGGNLASGSRRDMKYGAGMRGPWNSASGSRPDLPPEFQYLWNRAAAGAAEAPGGSDATP